MGKIQIDPKWDRLAREAAEARNLGMRYGSYKARQYELEVKLHAEQERRYQQYLAKKEAEKEAKIQEKRKAREALEQRLEADRPKCLWCGQEITGKSDQFCSRECWAKYYAEEIREKKRQQREDARASKRAGVSCAWCGRDMAFSSGVLYCCEECRKQAKKARRKQQWNPEG